MIEKKIRETIASMSIEELKSRLAAYMKSDASLMPRIVAIEVKYNPNDPKSQYDAFLIDEEGGEKLVKFEDRCSRLIYIYTLLHSKGYQRRNAAANNYRGLCQLYNQLYFRDSSALMKTIKSTDDTKPGQFLSHYIARSRKAVRQTSPLAEPFAIDRPQSHNGLVLIPFVAEGGKLIIDESLRHFMFNL